MFLGTQRRKISCTWSGRNCLGYNTEEDKQEYCSYGDFFKSFCGDWRRGEKSCTIKVGSTEKKRFFTIYDDTDKNADITTIVKNCDSPKKWTTKSVEPDIDINKYYRL